MDLRVDDPGKDNEVGPPLRKIFRAIYADEEWRPADSQHDGDPVRVNLRSLLFEDDIRVELHELMQLYPGPVLVLLPHRVHLLLLLELGLLELWSSLCVTWSHLFLGELDIKL